MKAGITWLIAGLVLLVLGAFVVPLIFILPLVMADSQEVKFKAPGSAEVTIEKPGRYYLWNHYETVYQGKSYDRPETLPDGMEIHIRDGAGAALEFQSDTSITSNVGGDSKRSIGYVEVGNPGKATVEVTGGSEECILSFAPFSLSKMLAQIAKAAGSAILVVFGGLTMVVTGIVKMVRASGKRAQPASGMSPPALGP